MFEDITKKIQDNIQQGMKDKFGLSDSESEQSILILFEKFKASFSEASMKDNLENVKHIVQDKFSETSNPLKEKFNKETINDLISKVGLNEETAKKVQDFSFDQYIQQMKASLAGLEDKLDISGIIDKIKPENLEGSAKDLMDNFGKLFNKK